MRRGDLVTVAMTGDFAKPRPALVIQADRFAATGTVVVLLITSTEVQAPLLRVPLMPDQGNGLRMKSFVMVDKVMTVKRERIGPVFGRVSDVTMLSISRLLTVFLGIA